MNNISDEIVNAMLMPGYIPPSPQEARQRGYSAPPILALSAPPQTSEVERVLEVANDHFTNKRYAKALEELDSLSSHTTEDASTINRLRQTPNFAVHISPHSKYIDGLVLRAKIFTEQGKFEDCLKEAALIQKCRPHGWEHAYFTASKLYADGKFEEADRLLSSVDSQEALELKETITKALEFYNFLLTYLGIPFDEAPHILDLIKRAVQQFLEQEKYVDALMLIANYFTFKPDLEELEMPLNIIREHGPKNPNYSVVLKSLQEKLPELHAKLL